ncbi:MAG: hypothetical protein K8L99_28940 [Anaerolineae bacterium]|nr:hypothetical protein [Anaerolineae bacterium]
MSKRLLMLVILLIWSSPLAAQNDSRDFNGYRWYDDGIHFTYPLWIAGDAVATFVPASAGSPESVKVIFQDYHDDVGWLPTGAEIQILPVTALPELDAAVLADHLRLLDNLDDMTITVAQAEALDFETGSGWRFVAFIQDEQGAANLSYRYLGKTADGLYLIRADFPFHEVQFDNVQSLDALSPNDFALDLETLDTLVASLSVTSPAATFLTAETGGQVDYQGIHFSYDPALAYRVEVDATAPVTPPEAESSMYGEMPGYTRFSLVGYPTLGRIQEPQLFVMPVDEFPAEDQPYGAQLQQLQSLLAAQPDSSPAADPGSQNHESLPIFPLINAAQTIVSQPQYHRFEDGEGLRYITYYAQSAEPLASNDLFYTFTGISDDDQYVVAAIFPLFAGFLPQGTTVYNIAEYERFMMNYQTYLDGLLLQINVMDQSAYLPQIDRLDAVIASLTLE